MGHTRLGRIPKSAKWSSIIELISGEGADEALGSLPETVSKIARDSLLAAETGLAQAANDIGLCYTLFLLIKTILAARVDRWTDDLERLGIRLTEKQGIIDLTVEIQACIDDHLFSHSCSTDIAEMAQKAACEALSLEVGTRQLALFRSGRDLLKEDLKQLSTKKGFGGFSQKFFGLFLARYLNFYISRATAGCVGGRRLNHLGDLSKFNETLKKHCAQSAVILADFSGSWFSKANFEGGIDFEKTKRFLAVAIDKLRSELKQQRGEL
jgi:hypothetical protein